MGATSVTGVGRGSADGKNKGSIHTTLGVDNLIGPRVMAAGTATLDTGAASVVLPAMDGVSADYIVQVTDTTSAAAVKGSLAITSTATTLTLAGTGSHVLAWSVIKVGISGCSSAVGND